MFPNDVELWFDGLCQPRNPGGWACYGWQIRSKCETFAEGKGVVEPPSKTSTNNVAEWGALKAGLVHLEESGWHGGTLPRQACGVKRYRPERCETLRAATRCGLSCRIGGSTWGHPPS